MGLTFYLFYQNKVLILVRSFSLADNFLKSSYSKKSLTLANESIAIHEREKERDLQKIANPRPPTKQNLTGTKSHIETQTP